MKKLLIIFIIFFSFFLFSNTVSAASVNNLYYGLRTYSVDYGATQQSSFTAQFGTNVPVMILSEPRNYTSYNLNGISFSMPSSTQGVGISYIIELSYTVGFDGLQSLLTSKNIDSYGYSLAFEQGSIVKQNPSISVEAASSSYFRVTIRNSVTLQHSTELTSIATSLSGDIGGCSSLPGMGITGCGATVNANLANIQLNVVISEDPNTALLGSIQQGINDIFSSNQAIIDQNNHTNDKLDNISSQNTEAEKTRKGIWQTIKDLPGTLVNKFLDMLKSLFIPSDEFFQNFINDFKDNFLEKLGFLAYPFELIGDILGRYMNIAIDSVISIPDIHEPFTGGLLIAATSVNLKEIFEHGAIGTMYGIYRSFVSVIIIFMFLNFAMRKYDEFVKNRGSGS